MSEVQEKKSKRASKNRKNGTKEISVLDELSRLPGAYLVIWISQWLIAASIGTWTIGWITDLVLPDNGLSWMVDVVLKGAWIFMGATRLSRVMFTSWTKRWYRQAAAWLNKMVRAKRLEGLHKELSWEFGQLRMQLSEATGSMPLYDALGEEIRQLVEQKLPSMIAYRMAVEKTLHTLRDQKASDFISEEFEQRIDGAIKKLEERQRECKMTFDELRAYVLEQSAKIVLSSQSVERAKIRIEEHKHECGILSDRIDHLLEESPDLDLYTQDMIA